MAECFVGRVGGLAAALGVGVLVALGAPTAWADDDSADGSSGAPSSASSQQQDPPAKPDRKRPSAPEKSSRSTPDSATSASDAEDKGSGAGPDSERSSSREEADNDVAVERTYQRRVQSRDAVRSTLSRAEDEDSPIPRSAKVEEHGVATAVEVVREVSEPSSPVIAESLPGTEPGGVEVTDIPEPVAVEAVSPQVYPPVLHGLAGRGGGDGVASPIVWAVAAAARRALGKVDIDTTAVPVTTGQPTSSFGALSSMTSSLPLNSDGTRALVTTVDGDWTTGFTTRAEVVDTTSGAPIGQPVTLDGDQWGAPVLSVDGSHVAIAAVAFDAEIGSTTSVVVINTITGAQIGRTFVVAGDTTGAGPQLLSADGTVVLIASAVYDSRTSTFATWLTVNDFTTDELVGATVIVPGSPYGPALVTRDGTRAVITTFVDDWETRSTSTRVAVIDTDSGAQIGSTVTLSGQPSGSTLSDDDGGTAEITTTTGLAATVNTETGSASVLPIAFPWGFDISAFLNTPLGQVVGGVVVSVYFVGSAFLVFYVVYPVINIFDWVVTAIGLPPVRF